MSDSHAGDQGPDNYAIVSSPGGAQVEQTWRWWIRSSGWSR